jgi:hypothetical protein
MPKERSSLAEAEVMILHGFFAYILLPKPPQKEVRQK